MSEGEVKIESAPTITPLGDAAPPLPKPNKILYLVTKSNFGGAQRYVYDLATHMPPDAEAVVLCGGGEHGVEEELLVNKLTESGVRSMILPELKRDISVTDFKALYHLWKAIRAEKPTVLHLNSSKAGGLGAVAGRLAGVHKIIFTAHGWPFNEKRNLLWRIFAWLASVATILLSSRVICVSTYDLKQFRGWFFARKLVGIRNALPPGEYQDKEDVQPDLVPRADLYARDIWVGYIGELNQNKNVELAVRAVANAIHRGCKIFFAIIGDGEDRIALEDLVEDLKMDQNIKFLGFLADAAMYMKAFDIFILPSRKEGLPYALLEAERAGVPVIASSVGGIPEIIHDGENGLLFQSENLEQLTEALVCLCNDQELRVQLSNKPAPEHFETMLRETFAQYR